MTLANRCLAAVFSVIFALTMIGCTHDTSFGQKIDDSTITAKVKSALLADPDVSGMAINVETVGGQVQLSGFVDSTAQARRAADIAGRVKGVDRVINNVSVKTQ